ncbi:MAG: hypothetical protein M3443_18785 [Actinomycetota bacterium]|nr:hypothetical protein [Actinomycetota bacterium]
MLVTLARVQTMLAAVGPRLAEAVTIADDSDWGGSAAEEFSDHGDDLPKGIAKGAESMGEVTKALITWGGQISANQDKAEDLEDKAKRLKKALRTAEAAQERARTTPRDRITSASMTRS